MNKILKQLTSLNHTLHYLFKRVWLFFPNLAFASSGLPVLDNAFQWILNLLTGDVALVLSVGGFATVLIDAFISHRLKWGTLILIASVASCLLAINNNVHQWLGM
ncbi:MAG: hypothetical protein KIT27_05505 [Legionellales bacterium]|nr:hypothetical protein [Legionellales bacterium]